MNKTKTQRREGFPLTSVAVPRKLHKPLERFSCVISFKKWTLASKEVVYYECWWRLDSIPQFWHRIPAIF